MSQLCQNETVARLTDWQQQKVPNSWKWG